MVDVKRTKKSDPTKRDNPNKRKVILKVENHFFQFNNPITVLTIFLKDLCIHLWKETFVYGFYGVMALLFVVILTDIVK